MSLVYMPEMRPPTCSGGCFHYLRNDNIKVKTLNPHFDSLFSVLCATKF